MSKLNREQIIKALECCHSSCIADCKQCPYKGKADCEEDFCITCLNVLIKDTLSLIKELTEENERLRAEVADLRDELQCEKETNKHLCGEYMSAKSDTVKKMQEMLKASAYYRCDATVKDRVFVVCIDDIDQIAKEMLEGKI